MWPSMYATLEAEAGAATASASSEAVRSERRMRGGMAGQETGAARRGNGVRRHPRGAGSRTGYGWPVDVGDHRRAYLDAVAGA